MLLARAHGAELSAVEACAFDRPIGFLLACQTWRARLGEIRGRRMVLIEVSAAIGGRRGRARDARGCPGQARPVRLHVRGRVVLPDGVAPAVSWQKRSANAGHRSCPGHGSPNARPERDCRAGQDLGTECHGLKAGHGCLPA
jgi:hypothetical protein